MSILERRVTVNLQNITCVRGKGIFAAVDRAIFTAHAAESDAVDYRIMRERVQIRAEWLDHVEWRDACADMRRREAAWIDGQRS